MSNVKAVGNDIKRNELSNSIVHTSLWSA